MQAAGSTCGSLAAWLMVYTSNWGLGARHSLHVWELFLSTRR